MVAHISRASLEEAARALVDRVEPWKSGSFAMVRSLHQAPCNHGRVDAFKQTLDDFEVAVKRMPNWWMLEGPDAFQESHCGQTERPWQDLGFLVELQKRGFPYMCELHGLFQDELTTYVVTTLGECGDLYSWSEQAPPPGPDREAAMKPLVAQLCPAVRFLHDAGVCHRDLSVENVVLSRAQGHLQVKIIDFGMASLGREQGLPSQGPRPKGKRAYQAPEEHDRRRPYDAFLADDFALGVVIYVMAVADYPWVHTKPDSPELHRAQQIGVRAMLAEQQVVDCGGAPLDQVITPQLLDLLSGLLAPSAGSRLSIGEACYSLEGRGSAASSGWLPVGSLAEAEPTKPCLPRRPTDASFSTVDSDPEELGDSSFVDSDVDEDSVRWVAV